MSNSTNSAGHKFRYHCEAVPNPEDGGKTTLHKATLTHTSCKEVVAAVTHAERRVAARMVHKIHRLNGRICKACHNNIAAQVVPAMETENA